MTDGRVGEALAHNHQQGRSVRGCRVEGSNHLQGYKWAARVIRRHGTIWRNARP